MPIKNTRDAVVASDRKADIAGVRADIADIKASVSKLPGYGSLIATALAIVGILLAALSFGNDRFSAGISLADQRQQQIKRDDVQDSALRRTDAKPDEILKRLPAR